MIHPATRSTEWSANPGTHNVLSPVSGRLIPAISGVLAYVPEVDLIAAPATAGAGRKKRRR